MEMQAQASNAQTLAMESKREAESLRQKAEQAELDFAAEESAREAEARQAPAPNGAGFGIAPQSTEVGGDPSYGYPPAGGLSLSGAPPLGGFGGPPMEGGGFDGFSGGIMGGSGGNASSLPSPTETANLYANPFG